MLSARTIFDRTGVIEALLANCLAEGGSSTVLIAPNKVGKTHLLDHLCSHEEKPASVLVCRINLDFLMMFARRRPSPKEKATISDDLLLRFFLDELHYQIEDWIDDLELRAPDLELRIAERERIANDLGEGEESRRARYEEGLHVDRRTLRELASLRSLADRIEAFDKSPDPLVAFDTRPILKRLQKLGKRVVLVVDDFHEMVRQADLTDDLYSFLRAANEEQLIVCLVASTLDLMDPSLHPADPEQREQRRALFNQFDLQPLPTFSRDEASEFLDWLGSRDEVLEPDEKRFLFDMSGGSAYFLRLAREEFVRRKRPAEAAWGDFREALADRFATGFRDLWRRCPTPKRKALSRLSVGEEVEDRAELRRLQDEGYLVVGDGAPRIFSPLFEGFVKKQEVGDSPATELEIVPSLRFATLPTALYFGGPDEMDPIVEFTVKNPTSERVSIQFGWGLPPYMSVAQRLVRVSPHSEERVPIQLTLRREQLEKLSGPEHGQVEFEATLKSGKGDELLARDWLRILVLPPDTFVLARYDGFCGELLDLSWTIAAWVNKRADALVPIRRRARNEVELVGYPKKGTPEEQSEIVEQQAAAIYKALREVDLRYGASNLTFHLEKNHYGQRVRPPARTLEEGDANCLEASVLFASLLSNIDLHPAILFLPGHALVGWRVGDKPDAEFEFLEMTRLKDLDFDAARALGNELYEEAKERLGVWPAERFALLIDIPKVWRERKIVTL